MVARKVRFMDRRYVLTEQGALRVAILKDSSLVARLVARLNGLRSLASVMPVVSAATGSRARDASWMGFRQTLA